MQGLSHGLHLPSGPFHLLWCGVIHSLRSGYLKHLLHRISPSWGCRGIAPRTFPPLFLSHWDCRAVSHIVLLRPSCLEAFSLLLLICALCWDCWMLLEPTVSASTQAPPCSPPTRTIKTLQLKPSTIFQRCKNIPAKAWKFKRKTTTKKTSKNQPN